MPSNFTDAVGSGQSALLFRHYGGVIVVALFSQGILKLGGFLNRKAARYHWISFRGLRYLSFFT